MGDYAHRDRVIRPVREPGYGGLGTFSSKRCLLNDETKNKATPRTRKKRNEETKQIKTSIKNHLPPKTRDCQVFKSTARAPAAVRHHQSPCHRPMRGGGTVEAAAAAPFPRASERLRVGFSEQSVFVFVFKKYKINVN